MAFDKRCVTVVVLLALLALASARPMSEPALTSTPDDVVGTNPKTCCTCKCVKPSKQRPGPGVGAIGPTYGRKNFCVNGFQTSCDAVCLVQNGSYTSYKEC